VYLWQQLFLATYSPSIGAASVVHGRASADATACLSDRKAGARCYFFARGRVL